MMVFNNYIGQTLGTNPQLILKREKSVTGHEISIFLKKFLRDYINFNRKYYWLFGRLTLNSFSFLFIRTRLLLPLTLFTFFCNLLLDEKKNEFSEPVLCSFVILAKV